MIEIEGKVIRSIHQGVPVSFFVRDPNDLIQAFHARGEFYEREELSIITDFFNKGSVFLDVGANIGNHAIYVAKFLHPRQLILLEPNPPAIEILQINIELNKVAPSVDFSMIGTGLSDSDGWAGAHIPAGNLGATTLWHVAEESKIRLARGDSLFLGRRIDFIKMDVEGMEIRALKGLMATINANRPTMFIEVDNVNRDEFLETIKSIDYSIATQFRRYPQNENFLVIPIEAASLDR